MKTKLKTLIRLLKKRKFDMLLDSIAWSVPRWLFYYNHTILITTDCPGWKPCTDARSNIRFVVPEDIRHLAKDGFTDEKVKSRLDSGDRGALLEEDDKAKSIVWGSRGRKFLNLSGVAFDPGDDGFFLYGASTDPNSRNRGFFYLVSDFIWSSYRAEGIKRIFGTINANNGLWLGKLVNDMNFKPAGESYYLKILFINITYLRSWPLPAKKINVFFKIPPDNLKCV